MADRPSARRTAPTSGADPRDGRPAPGADPPPRRGDANAWQPALWTLPVAYAAWWVIFAWQPANFWMLMGGGTALLGTLALALRGGFPFREGVRQGDFTLGLVSAAVLYGVFFIGRLVVPASQVGAVYAVRGAAPAGLIAVLLLLVIGPGEELYWRGLVQRALARRLPGWAAVVGAAALYGAAHVASRNPTLVLAAFVGGLFWGGLYLRTGRIAPVIVSHALWDLAVLLILPLGGGH